ncbi:MAG: tRNA (adenosine(37)-N6)-threonylcarbamoyltransferase complex ATPase subunit type 1 TsaE [Candidatus Moranbacteria bacterium]|nr:tRNA (adenosine(37)-N6)-threonylcarbamoyltransferase complex ATPase subunit type 1 TsaE [Candidatus Moranbacteria bacterium]
MRNDKFLSPSASRTQEIGCEIGKSLRGGEIIFLSGILGAGKTVLVRGIAKSLGIRSKVPSPTFNIFRVYDCVLPKSKRKGKFYHFDCYRLKKYTELRNLGWEEILADSNAITVLEWPECISDRDVIKTPDKKIIAAGIKLENNKRVVNITVLKR